MRVFEGKHSQDWAEIAENEEICDLHDKNGGLRFFWQLVQLNYALVSQMECLELFIFENGQPMTMPPPKVYFWAFRLTVTSGPDDNVTRGGMRGPGAELGCHVDLSRSQGIG